MIEEDAAVAMVSGILRTTNTENEYEVTEFNILD
jgi:hypothetical protein